MKKRPAGFNVVREMHDAANVIRGFSTDVVRPFAENARRFKGLFLTGEGSSRMFPAAHAAWLSMRDTSLPRIYTAGSTEALDFDLDDYAVFAASNSGRTKETIRLLDQLRSSGHQALFAVTNAAGSPITEKAVRSYILSCGMEKAIPATKSLVEQALFYHTLIFEMADSPLDGLNEAGDAFEEALSLDIAQELIELTANASFIYFAGWGSGVADELSLKAGELLRKKTRFLDGTLLLHGIEEIMDRGELIVLIDPSEEDEGLILKRLTENIGVNVVAISERQTMFPTVIVPQAPGFECYVQTAAAWNLLVEAGMTLKLDMDSPARVKKVGNLY
jgi:glucosamine--fructose-6-phosphate aminotransferase (isomerizing)